MAEEREIRDPVHDFILLSSKEADIIGSPIFQRLRGIRQLAFAYLVYPGAHHTRFEHSLGVCHLAGLMAKRLSLNKEKRRITRLAALVHDIGHGPFSHVSEQALERYVKRDKIADRLINNETNIHELLTQDFVMNDADLKRFLGEDDCKTIAQLLAEGYDEPLLKSVISGSLDADKQDYLLRDSHYCGVKYGIFDVEQMHRALIADDPGDGSTQLMISEDGIHALEQFVFAKYFMTTQVYRHRVRLITDQMLVRSISLGIDRGNIQELYDIYAYDGSPEFTARYIKWDDSRFLNYFGGDSFSGTWCNRLLDGLRQRRLLKKIYGKRLKELPEDCREGLEQIQNTESHAKRSEMETAIYDLIPKNFKEPLDSGNMITDSVILHLYKFKSVREQSRDKEGPILVGRAAKPKTFEEESTLFHSIDETLTEAHVEIYAPVIYESASKRRMLLNEVEGPITDVLSQLKNERGSNHEST
jgi:HD superfamily phosphohydrolase